MTRTEERLTDALAARAAVVREDSLRPLVAEGRGAHRGEEGQRAGRAARLAPLAAATAMLLVIGGTIFGVHELFGATNASFADVASANSPPPYYVDLDWNHILTVRATATGQLTDRLPPPEAWSGPASRLETALASAANGRTFVVIYNDRGDGPGPYRTAIYKFALTSAGHIADFTRVKEGVLPGLARISAAVSPNGSKVAIAGVPEAAAEGNGQPLQPARIVVVNLRTGRRVVFQGGMDRRGQQFGIGNVSWANDGRSLAYLAQWCPSLDVQFTAVCDGTRFPASQMRIINALSDGGPLNGSRSLLRGFRRSQWILQALISPDGQSVLALAMRGNDVCVLRFALRTGGPAAVLYCRRAMTAVPGTFLVSDGTGRYLIVDEDFGSVDGWVHDGSFHPMKIGRVELWSAPAW